jgi:regulation of enolase protein 1 (concanavalin A-like superfamily)
MIRENLNAGARHASLFATPGKGIAFQRRLVENGLSIDTPGPMLTAPVWLRLSRQGDVVAAYFRRSAADLWTKIGEETLTGLVDAPLVGLAVTSHAAGTLATAAFNGVGVSPTPAWSGASVGTGTGSLAAWDGTVMTVEGTGSDIWNTADAFFFVNTPWEGGGTITARVRRLTDTNAWSKAGVMFRETLDPASAHVMLIASPEKGLALQYRSSTGGISQSVAIAGAAPEWLRLTRAGDAFTASVSQDGSHWTTVGTVTVPMEVNVLAGLPVTSHDRTASATAAFDDIAIAP